MVDIEVVVGTEAGHRVAGTGARFAEHRIAGHMLSGMVVVAGGIVPVMAYSRAVLVVLVQLACQADCHNWHRNARQERFSARNWYRRHLLVQRSLLAGSVHSCYSKHCWLVLLPGRRDSGGLKVVPVSRKLLRFVVLSHNDYRTLPLD